MGSAEGGDLVIGALARMSDVDRVLEVALGGAPAYSFR
jgi:hypothetical protein